jgi:hypothetical protein
MKKELDDLLVEKYPKIFRDRYADMRITAMCWGAECGSGWFWLIDKLCERIQSHIDLNPHLNIEQVIAVQVKEKFGGLRFYYNGGNDYIDGMVSLAEHLSYYICENCGTTENVTQNENGWIFTLCYKCRSLKDSGKELDNLL